MPLTAGIESPAGQTDARALSLTLRITNSEDRTISILNPDLGVPSPRMNWPESNEVYRTFLLISFGYLSIRVTDDAGKELPQRMFTISATPALRPPIELAQGDSLEVKIAIGSFYQLEPNEAYEVAIEYGDEDLKVSARTRFVVP